MLFSCNENRLPHQNQSVHMLLEVTHWQHVVELATSARVVVIACHCYRHKCRHLKHSVMITKITKCFKRPCN